MDTEQDCLFSGTIAAMKGIPIPMLAGGITWAALIVWMGLKMFFAPEGVEDERGFRTLPPKR